MSCIFSRLILLLAAASLVVASDASLEVREHEELLAKAIRGKQSGTLSAMIGQGFHTRWQCGSGERTYDVTVHRDDWVSDLRQMRVESYEAKVSNVRVMPGHRPDGKPVVEAFMVQAMVDEVWTIRSGRGNTVEKRFSAMDVWLNQKGTWTLVTRMYGPNSCVSNGEHLIFP